MFGYDFDWTSIPGALPFLWSGMKITLQITLVAIVFGIAWGTLIAMARLSGIRWLSMLAAGYDNLFRSIPLVMVILWFYLIVPQLLTALFGNTTWHATDALDFTLGLRYTRETKDLHSVYSNPNGSPGCASYFGPTGVSAGSITPLACKICTRKASSSGTGAAITPSAGARSSLYAA